MILGSDFFGMIVTSSVTGTIIPFVFINFKEASFACTAVRSFFVKRLELFERERNIGICSLYFAEFFTAISIPLKARYKILLSCFTFKSDLAILVLSTFTSNVL